ncbi:hypothetical protein EZ821_06825 [Salmonella enterica subsp. enterica serovar Adelaide]|uniref:Uncharacterized protein n=2 Tax=Salmonella enterica TaxID=28901 RepID=A0A639YS44_SALER|nr:hypothetical protein [Salmonella enterica subsp. enterica serovar Poona]EAO6252208.1 hypothetical protein [Salmonella enterica]EBS2908726.1 hypothetical protein [Salmonella enterica subsp. enterica serovar Flottbek]EBV1873328.1 hypothetical protein [Salmonella enterica subsp. enterica serovar Adelaide]ECC9076388.1 hypothetical protein [Salmonella enterica subsp. enterica]ECT8498888.1 hypothetical protein [Salmonella enterica subsp. enterica serovar Pensacola]EDQ0314429.1 hypothetical prote
MAIVKRKSVNAASATGKAIVSVHVENGKKPGLLTLDDFTSEYRAVVKELLTLKRKNAVKSGNFDNPVLNRVVEQAVMRIVYVGQKQKIAPSKVRQMVTSSSNSARSQRNWQPQKALERSSGMLTGASRLRKIG